MTGGPGHRPVGVRQKSRATFRGTNRGCGRVCRAIPGRVRWMFSYDSHDSVSNAENQVPSEIRKNDVNLQAQVKPLPIYGLASDLTPTLRNRWPGWAWV